MPIGYNEKSPVGFDLSTKAGQHDAGKNFRRGVLIPVTSVYDVLA